MKAQDSFGPSGRALVEQDFRAGCALSGAAPSVSVSDRELLEKAAKAAGYRLDGLASKHVAQGIGPDDYLLLNERGGHSVWNPLTDDGDALRLAVKLDLIPGYFRFSDMHVVAYTESGKLAATRRAIVRAAAALAPAPTEVLSAKGTLG